MALVGGQAVVASCFADVLSYPFTNEQAVPDVALCFGEALVSGKARIACGLAITLMHAGVLMVKSREVVLRSRQAGEAEPASRLAIVLPLVSVHDPGAVLCIGMALVGRYAEKLHRLVVVHKHARLSQVEAVARAQTCCGSCERHPRSGAVACWAAAAAAACAAACSATRARAPDLNDLDSDRQHVRAMSSGNETGPKKS
eukprot:CAMPEP_0179855014 /NCGR_PEP_ID=MMETSP0982-20121206/10281_1 /TAXON_ID=483367 /ORGANISM="non described non described, Strain CCMP 2436" /LENGTH=199 /DNA_ID=CAMNT_0021741019 /DNA_START=187 /DNA_END=785 /DNA_ORIENTATION=+